VREEEAYVAPLDMAQVIQDVERRLAQVAQETQAQIVKPAAWPEALGHAPWVEEVWANYLSNAMVYGGLPPRIELGAEELEPIVDPAVLAGGSDEQDLALPPGMVRFWVRDNGDGIDPEFHADLFLPFSTRHSENGKNERRGHGLGLSIVKRIVEKLGGSVGVESSGKPGEGSLFYFTLPAAPPHFELHES
jgi:signal transduction histidine kinase